MSDSNYKYLLNIDSPDDLKKLPKSALPEVCDEVREFVVDTISKIGGHFGAGLGMVELSVALHYVFNTPKDKIVIDTGHQAYPHKILTGRRDLLHTIRQKDGISGFLKRTESEYDVFGAGHASTSISAALGIATARDLNKEDYRVVAVIGDGAMTGGLAYEAMNNCGFQQRDITVILNDNNMSIASNVSAFSNYFNEVFASTPLQKIRENIWNLTHKFDHLGDRLRKVASKLEDGVKAIITPGVLFEALGFNYIGPINGNNVGKLVKILESVKDFHGPILLHVITQKGYGYKPAENDKQFLHAIGKIDKLTGKSLAKKPEIVPPPNYQDVFGQAVLEICKGNPKVVAITAAMPDGTGLNIVQAEMPERVFDVGIAEGHAVTFAAGLACEGIIPIVAIYSTFLQRAFDHLVHDVALQKLHVIFALDRAGLVGADGPTHHGVMDLAYLRPVQNIVIMAPKDEQELRNMMFSAVNDYTKGPVAIRFPRGAAVGLTSDKMESIPLGTWEILKEGKDIVILAVGKLVIEATNASKELEKEGYSVEVINARFIKPLDYKMLDYISSKFKNVLTYEDGTIIGGFGSAVLEYYAEKKVHNVNLKICGLPDVFIDHATQEEQYFELKLDSKGIQNTVKEVLKSL
jgi:1-deoxy-D-xylulose-5-phosphate synthase